MAVIVTRGLGDKAGDDIISEVLSTEGFQRERGRQAINETDSDRIMLSGSAVNTNYMPPGSIIQVSDSGTPKKGYLEDYAKTVTMEPEYSATSSVNIEQIKND